MKRNLCRYCARWVSDPRRAVCDRCDDTRRVLRRHRRRVPKAMDSDAYLAKTYGCSEQRVKDLLKGDTDD